MPRDLDPARVSAQARDPQHAAARRLLPDGAATSRLSQLCDLAARILGVSTAHVCVRTDVTTIVGAAGGALVEHGHPSSLTQSLSALTARTGRAVVVNDAAADERVADLDAVISGAVGSACAVPIVTADAIVVGALSAFDAQARIWAQSDIVHLQEVAQAVHAELELAALTREFDSTRKRWNLAIEAAGIGSFDWNLRTGQLVWDDRLVEMFGYSDDDRFDESIEAFNARLHPDDLPRVTLALQTALDSLREYEAEYRVVLPSGIVRQIQARGRAVGDSSGRAVRLSGAAWDVSTTRDEQRNAGNILEAMPVAHIGVGTDWRIRSVNSAAESLLDVARWDLADRDVWEALAPLVGTPFETGIRAAAADGVGRTIDSFYPHPVARWVEVRTIPDPSGVAIFMTDVSDRHHAEALAAEVAEHDRNVAVALQNAMLTRLPESDLVEIRSRYLTAAARDQVGGDWYDAMVRPDGVTSIAVGDVTGHDIEAAARMGQLRSMLRAFAWEDAERPSANLAKLDRAMRDLHVATQATCVLGRIEQDDPEHDGVHTLVWSNAGNLPPLIIGVDGTVALLSTPADVMLGVEPLWERHDHRVEIAAGSTILLYTDGLVESRVIDLDTRLAELAAVAQRHAGAPLQEMVDDVLSDMVGDQPEDDVVVLGVRLRDSATPAPEPG